MRDRLPPHDTEAELGVLSCILTAPERSIPLCQERFPAGQDVFYDGRRGLVYSTALELFNEQRPVDPITVQAKLRERDQLEQVGGLQFVVSLPDLAPSPANLEAYLDVVEDLYLRRQIIKTCTEQVTLAYESQDTADTLLDSVERAVMAIRQGKPKTGQTTKELVHQAISRIEDLWSRKGAIDGIPTGLTDLDRITGGLKPGEVTIIAGYPGSGKTSIAMNIAEHAMLQAHKKVGVFSLEMSAISLVTRFICSHARVNLKNVSHGFLTKLDFPKLTTAAARISSAAIWFQDDSDLSINQLRARARRLHQQHAIDVAVIDYLQLLSAIGGARKIESRQQEVADISRGVKAISRELNIPIIALSQLNDDGKLRESRAIGQDADNVWVLKPNDSNLEETQTIDALPVTLNIVKARNGPRGTVTLTFLPPFTRFESAVKIEPDYEHSLPYND